MDPNLDNLVSALRDCLDDKPRERVGNIPAVTFGS
jgi:hypothetical protein